MGRWSIGTLLDTKLDYIYEELNGQEEAAFFVPNNSTNRAYVLTDRNIPIKFDGGTLFNGFFAAVNYERKRLNYCGYNESYEKMRKTVITADYSSGYAGTRILNDVCTLAGVFKGECPTSGTFTVEFDLTYCYDALQFLAEAYNVDYWEEGGTVNIGVRDTCVCCLPFDEGSGTACLDVSGHNNHGTINSGTWTTGKWSGSAVFFNGTACVDIAYNADMIPANLSIECWVLPSAGTSSQYFLARAHGYALEQIYGTQLNFYVYDGAAYQLTQTTIASGTWTHVTATAMTGTQRLYKDGIFVASSANTYAPDAGSICTVGAWLGTAATGKCWLGTLDELLIWNRRLDDDEIKLHFDSHFMQVQSRSLDRSKKRDIVYYKGKDSGGTIVYGSAGSGTHRIVFRESKAVDADTLDALATNRLAQLNNDNSSIVVVAPIHMVAHMKPGDIIPLHDYTYNLDGNYRIQKITKYSSTAKIEVDRKIEALEDKLLELSRYEGLGITQTYSP